jgi:thioredoxin-like negative regulator of GroEL
MLRVLEIDGRDLLRDLEALGGDALVVLGTESCGACRRARQVLRGLTHAEVGGADFLVAEVDALHAMGLIEEWEVHQLPGLVLVRDGEPWRRVSARLVPSELAQAIASARRMPPDPEL